MMTAQDRTNAFNAIDKSKNGRIDFEEWYAHFKGWAEENNMSRDELKMVFNAYDEGGTVRGVDFEEYTNFMNDIFGEAK